MDDAGAIACFSSNLFLRRLNADRAAEAHQRSAAPAAHWEFADESLTMDGMDKRALKLQYRESEIPVGIYRVVNTQADRSLVGSSVNLPAILNRHRADLKMGAHRNQELQRDWNQLGEDAFGFEILDTLSPRAEPGYDLKRELATLEELWLERLTPYGERGYNTRPK